MTASIIISQSLLLIVAIASFIIGATIAVIIMAILRKRYIEKHIDRLTNGALSTRDETIFDYEARLTHQYNVIRELKSRVRGSISLMAGSEDL